MCSNSNLWKKNLCLLGAQLDSSIPCLAHFVPALITFRGAGMNFSRKAHIPFLPLQNLVNMYTYLAVILLFVIGNPLACRAFLLWRPWHCKSKWTWKDFFPWQIIKDRLQFRLLASWKKNSNIFFSQSRDDKIKRNVWLGDIARIYPFYFKVSIR